MKHAYLLFIPLLILAISCRKQNPPDKPPAEEILTEATWTGQLRIVYDTQGHIDSQDTIDDWQKTFNPDGTVELKFNNINLANGTWRLEDGDQKIIYNWGGGDEIYFIKKLDANSFIETSDDRYLELRWKR